MSSGNKLKVADQKFSFCQVCFYQTPIVRSWKFIQRNISQIKTPYYFRLRLDGWRHRSAYYFRYIITPCSGLTGGPPPLRETGTGRMTRPQASLRKLSHLASWIIITVEFINFSTDVFWKHVQLSAIFFIIDSHYYDLVNQTFLQDVFVWRWQGC